MAVATGIVNAPDIGRIFDYWFGQTAAYDCDRQLADRLEAAWGPQPAGRVQGPRDLVARSRMYIDRAVSQLCHRGLRQFIVLSPGLPVDYPARGMTMRAVHNAAPPARVCYVTADGASLPDARLALRAAGGTAVICADPAMPHEVLMDPGLLSVIDPAKPAGVVWAMGAALHHPWMSRAIVAEYMRVLPVGSHLVATVPACFGADLWGRLVRVSPGREIYNYSQPDVVALFALLELAGEGVEEARTWGPQCVEPESAAVVLAGVGRKIRQPEA